MPSKENTDSNPSAVQYALGIVEKRIDGLDEKCDKHAEAIAKLTAIVTNGLTGRIEAMDKRWWAVAGGMLVLAAGMIVQIFLHYAN